MTPQVVDSKPPSHSAQPLTYRSAGVDIDAGNEVVSRIGKLVESTRRPEQLSSIGGFAGLIGMPAGMRDPVLVSCADGVGTKLLVAIAMDRHDTVGIDLVAMNVNDLLVTGAQPFFVLDYVAVGKVRPDVVEGIVAGIAEGCRQSGAALLGGETAELPGMYQEGHYDLAAFAVGVADRDALWGPERARDGDVILALPSSGLHSNGYSLARKALLDPAHGNLALDAPLPSDTSRTVGEALLEPTLIYAPAFASLRALEGGPVHGAAHITGGGLVENPQRPLPETLAVEMAATGVERPAILREVMAQGVPEDEVRRTFNCGMGMLLYVDPDRVQEVRDTLAGLKIDAQPVGRVIPRTGADGPRVLFTD